MWAWGGQQDLVDPCKGDPKHHHQETIPPLTKQDDTTATSSREKAEMLANLFSARMITGDPTRPPPQMACECNQIVVTEEETQEQVGHLLKEVNANKASGPDDMSPH